MTTTIARFAPPVAHKGSDLVQLLETLRDDAALALDACLDGISQQNVKTARVPSANVSWVSRAKNGSDSNPLYRIAGVFVLMKRLGLGRERALRVLGWLREIVDQLWPESEVDLNQALDEDQALDPENDTLRYHARLGCRESQRRLLEVERRQLAHASVVVSALRHSLGGVA